MRSTRRVAAGRRAEWLGVGVVSLALVLLNLAGSGVERALRYERVAVLHGQWWRLVTAHWVHGSARHLVLNVAGLLVLAQLFMRDFFPGEWLAIVMAAT